MSFFRPGESSSSASKTKTQLPVALLNAKLRAGSANPKSFSYGKIFAPYFFALFTVSSVLLMSTTTTSSAKSLTLSKAFPKVPAMFLVLMTTERSMGIMISHFLPKEQTSIEGYGLLQKLFYALLKAKWHRKTMRQASSPTASTQRFLTIVVNRKRKFLP